MNIRVILMNNQKLNKTDSYKGRLLYEAVTNEHILNSIERQKQFFKHYVVILIGCIVLIVGITYALFTMDLDSGDIAGIMILYLIMIPILYISIWGITNISFSKDQIYENGISSFTHTLRDYLNDNIFHRYEEITKIGWGYGVTRAERNKQFRFVAIYVNNEYRHTTVFDDDKNINDFFDILINTLKKKCPNVPWIQMDWKALPWPK
jgi:hypothetical protein